MNTARHDGNYPSPTYAWYVVTVLTLAYVVSFLDRQILALLVEPIRSDLGLSDTQMGLVMGVAFALFYTILGIPIGRLADRYSRRGIIAAGVTIWCLMTAACGLSRNFTQLFLARVGVGVGEATLNPSALSLISDYFPRERRGRAISFYNMGVSLGAGIAMIVGGWIIAAVSVAPPIELPLVGKLFAWQTVFMIVGLPGLIIAVLMITVREPQRRGKIRVRTADGVETEQLSVALTVRYLAERWQLYGSHFLGMSVVTCIGYGFLFWIPTMIARTWQWDIPRISLAYGLVNLVAGPIGVNVAGWFSDRLYRTGHRDGHMRACVTFCLLFVPCSILAPLMPSAELAIAMLVPASIGAAGVTATGVAGLMMITPNQLRAQSTALYYFVINVIGLSIGSAAVGAITDYVFGDEAALRYTLAIVATGAGLVGFVFLTLNLRLYRRAMDEVESWSD
jgi:MFS family permease